jgi:hypothetical protein
VTRNPDAPSEVDPPWRIDRPAGRTALAADVPGRGSGGHGVVHRSGWHFVARGRLHGPVERRPLPWARRDVVGPPVLSSQDGTLTIESQLGGGAVHLLFTAGGSEF